jgi:hypothetical protein
MSNVVTGVRAFLAPPPRSPSSYIYGSKIAILGVMVALSVVPDGFFLWLVLPRTLWWLAVAVDVLDAYAAIWLFGIYGSMANRPHCLEDDTIVVRNGLYQSVDFSCGDIACVRKLGLIRRFKLPKRPATIPTASFRVWSGFELKRNVALDTFLRDAV